MDKQQDGRAVDTCSEVGMKSHAMQELIYGRCVYEAKLSYIDMCLLFRRVCVSRGAVWCVKAATDLWLCRTLDGFPIIGSYCSMTHWYTHRYTNTRKDKETKQKKIWFVICHVNCSYSTSYINAPKASSWLSDSYLLRAFTCVFHLFRVQFPLKAL